MTRVEAETKLFQMNVPRDVSGRYSILDVLEALGVLKFDKEETVKDVVLNIIGKIENDKTGSPLGSFNARAIVYKLEAKGYKIVKV